MDFKVKSCHRLFSKEKSVCKKWSGCVWQDEHGINAFDKQKKRQRILWEGFLPCLLLHYEIVLKRAENRR